MMESLPEEGGMEERDDDGGTMTYGVVYGRIP